jgi:hypothetical protein
MRLQSKQNLSHRGVDLYGQVIGATLLRTIAGTQFNLSSNVMVELSN